MCIDCDESEPEITFVESIYVFLRLIAQGQLWGDWYGVDGNGGEL